MPHAENASDRGDLPDAPSSSLAHDRRPRGVMQALELRVPPPLLMLAVGAVMALDVLTSAEPLLPTAARLGLVALFSVAAGSFAYPAVAAFSRAKTTINPVQVDRASSLVTTGIYRVTRNPMYVALTLLLCAWAAWLARPLPGLGPVAFLLFIDRFQIVPEERVLQKAFGEAYAAYRRSVRRWI